MKRLLCTILVCIVTAKKKEDNPVTRVVGLLEDLKERIGKDGKREQAAYDEYACWCEKTTAKQADTITSIKDVLTTTGNTILKLTGAVATLESEIAGLKEDIAKNIAQQEATTNIREKESAAFVAEAAETQQAIAALEKAITVLKAATTNDSSGAALVQTQKWSSTMTELVSKMSQASVSMKLTQKQISLLGELSGKRQTSSYAPQSATIQGILTDMYVTFVRNLQVSTAEEAKAYRAYEDLMAVLQKQLATLQEDLVKKENEKTEVEIQLADANQLYADSEEQLKSETEVFDATKASCSEKTEEWTKRSSLRATELEGIEKALEILTDEDNKEIFEKAIKPGFSGGAKEGAKEGASSFVQIESHVNSGNAAEKAIDVLESRARQSHSFRLASLAVTMRAQDYGHFDKVMDMIDKLLLQLQEEEQADIKKVNDCKDQYQTITLNKNDLDWKITNNKAKVQKHEHAIEDKEEQKEITITSIEEADKLLEKMAKERKEGNDAYLEAKSNDEKAIELLTKAKEALAEYYKSDEYKESLLQQPGAPDARLSGKDSAKLQSKDVTKFLQMIITDLEQELTEAKAAEVAAQTDYEKMKAAVEDQKAKLEKKKINLDNSIAEEESAKSAEEDLQKSNEDSLETEKETEADLKKTCDDAIKLQPERREKRKIEAEGLRQAKDFLAGLTSDALIQSSKTALRKNTRELGNARRECRALST
jgi:hypothetical protein